MQMQWNILQPDHSQVREISAHLGCHPIIATILANRSITTVDQAAAFLEPTMDILPSPLELSGMEAATRRIFRALEHKERILVLGDYDVDGVTATALLVQFLKSAGADVMAHIPHRIEEGYGLQPKHINQLAAPHKVGVIITVDNGSSSHAAVEAAQRFGIDTIITDHHNIDTPPPAMAVINPKITGEPSALAGLAGVGVAFYLAIGLRMLLRRKGWWASRKEPNLISLCDFVALGTIADMVPLTGVNRVLAKAGLKQLNTKTRPGVEALRQTCNLRHGVIGSDDIAFRLAPRINAAGRIAHAHVALDLLNAPAMDSAQKLADTLNQLNQRRQAIGRQIYDQIIKRIGDRADIMDRKSILLADENWHPGVLGIVAAQLTNRLHRPVVLLATQNGIGKGSGRSTPEIDLYAALSRCVHLLEKFGGHRMAAGLTVKTENIRKLQEAFEEAVIQFSPTDGEKPALQIDSDIQFDQIGPRLMNELEALEPFGIGNPAPLFAAHDVKVASAAIVGNRHRRMSLCQMSQNGPAIDAMQFNLTPETPRVENFARIAFRLQWNRYRGEKRIQMVVEDF